FDPERPEKRLDVRASVGGTTVWLGRADAFRSDVLSAGYGDGCYGFRAELTSVDENASEVRFTVVGSDVELAGSPVQLERVTPEVAAWDPAESAFLLSRAEPTILGSLDDVTPLTIRGWALNDLSPSQKVVLELRVDGQFQRLIRADQLRVDLAAAGIGDGACGFEVPAPVSLSSGSSHLVELVLANTDTHLPGSPRTIASTLPASVRLFADARAVLERASEQLTELYRELPAERAKPLAAQAEAYEAYARWRARFSELTPEIRRDLKRQALNFGVKPKISIVLPTYNTPIDFLDQAINSVKAQIYDKWELCISDDCSPSAETREYLAAVAENDPRIKLVTGETNVGIARNSNRALGTATGDYVCFLDHDDVLTEDALFWMVDAINESAPQLIYSDEDKIDPDGAFVDPHFKPDWNYTLLLSYNYICHLLCIRADVLRAAGEFREEFEGAQDYDLVLRCAERVGASNIRHIPRVLYHWRAHPASTAASGAAKGYAADAGRRAIQAHLDRLKVAAKTEIVGDSGYRVRWPVSSGSRPKVSVVVPTRDQAGLLAQCASSVLHRTSYDAVELVVVNNSSEARETYELFEVLERDERVRIVNCDEPFNFSRLCNIGVERASGDLILLLNNDVEAIHEDWLDELVSQVQRDGVAAAGAKLLYPDGRVQHAGVILGIGGVAGHAHKYFGRRAHGYMSRALLAQELSACTAACLIIRRECYEAVGGLDEANLAVAFNDVDLCLRLRERDWKVVFTPFAELFHHESISRGQEDRPAKVLRFNAEVAYMRRRWGKILERDPSYSPNLSLLHENFSVDPARGVGERPAEP
ncbi:MAG: glycosyl transferase family 2, partial [Enterovirga sp.]|nr:glycosyl transferase family 2 [Enterovirga sp.]